MDTGSMGVRARQMQSMRGTVQQKACGRARVADHNCQIVIFASGWHRELRQTKNQRLVADRAQVAMITNIHVRDTRQQLWY